MLPAICTSLILEREEHCIASIMPDYAAAPVSRQAFANAACAIIAVLQDFREYSFATSERSIMNEDSFNMAVRRFLKEVGVTSQREIELVVREGKVKGSKLKLRIGLSRRTRHWSILSKL